MSRGSGITTFPESVRGPAPSCRFDSSLGRRISSAQALEDRIILQGVDTDVPWSATVDKETGKLVATESRKDISFTVFGACMP